MKQFGKVRVGGKVRKYAADCNAIYRVMAKNQPLTIDEQAQVINPIFVAYSNMGNGTATAIDFNYLGECANVCMVQAEKMNEPSLIETVSLAMQAVLKIKERHENLGKWGLCHFSMLHIPPILEMYEQIVQLLTPKQTMELLRETQERIRKNQVVTTKDLRELETH